MLEVEGYQLNCHLLLLCAVKYSLRIFKVQESHLRSKGNSHVDGGSVYNDKSGVTIRWPMPHPR